MSIPKATVNLPTRLVENPRIDAPRDVGAGEKVKVTGGDIPPVYDDQMQQPGQTACGVEATALGDAYVAVGGPNRGEAIQQCRTPDGRLLGVPVRRLRRAQGDAAPRVVAGWRQAYKSAEEERTAEAERATRWREVRPGRRRLA